MYTTTTLKIGRNDMRVRIGIDFSTTVAGDLVIDDLSVVRATNRHGIRFRRVWPHIEARILRSLSPANLEAIEEACERELETTRV
jgi:hypothetical protein